MGQNGTNTITALKTATGINSNDLSDHHPSGPGVLTKMGYWFILGFDTSNLVSTSPPTALYDERDVPSNIFTGDVFSLWILPKSGEAKITGTRGDESVLQGTIDNGGLLTPLNLNNMQINNINFDKTVPGETFKGIEVVVECTADGSLSVVQRWDDGKYNSDTIGYDTLEWEFSDQADEAANIFTTTIYQCGTDVCIDYTIDGGTPNFDIEINRSDDGGSTYTNIDNITKTSKGSYTYTDNGADTSQSYIYEMICVDSKGSQDTAGGPYTP